MKRKCTNAYMVSQCKMFLSNMALFKNGLELAAKKNDGVTDPDEARMIKEINRDLEKLRVKIEQYI